jgi:hypothetical protein
MLDGINALIKALKKMPIHDPRFREAFLAEIRQSMNENFTELVRCTIESLIEQKAGSPTL